MSNLTQSIRDAIAALAEVEGPSPAADRASLILSNALVEAARLEQAIHLARPPIKAIYDEHAKFPVGNRDASDQRFGQHIFNKFGYEFENSYQIEDKRECLAVLVRGLK